jgi:agmatinase
MGPRRPRWRGRLDMPFIGLQSFLRRPMIADLEVLDADVAVLGVPTDEAPVHPGSRSGPRAIREHSLRFTAGGPGD